MRKKKEQIENVKINVNNSEIKLTLNQENFCREYVKTRKGHHSYIYAYGRNNMSDDSIYVQANKLLNNPKIILRIKELRNNIEEALEIDKLTIINDLLRIRDRCLEPIPVMEWVDTPYTTKTGKLMTKKELKQKTNEDGELVWTFDSKGANQAIDKIMKSLGHYEPTKVKIEQDVDLSKLSPEEIKQLALIQSKLHNNE
jgi:hypothetical protein